MSVGSAPPISVSMPAYAVGELVPLEQAAGPAASPELIGRLRKGGFDRCSVSAGVPSELAAEAVRDALRGCGLAPRAVDAVVYATCSHEADAAPEELAKRLGVPGSPVYGVWLGESGNLAPAFRLARVLHHAEGCGNVLVVVADAVPNRPGEYRAMPNAVTINGDGAAACVLSTRRPGPYLLEALAQSADPKMTAEGRGQGLREYLEFMAGVRYALDALHKASGIERGAHSWLVANNYSSASLDDFADVVGVPRENVYRDGVARHGHLFAADGLANLAGLTRRGNVLPGERVLVLCTGPFSWGALQLLRTEFTSCTEGK